jgi:hypothetical protein
MEQNPAFGDLLGVISIPLTCLKELKISMIMYAALQKKKKKKILICL